MSANSCLVAEYACFVDPLCRQCLDMVHSAVDGNGTKAHAFNAPACTAASNSALLNDFVNLCGESFPRCTFFTQRCASMPECALCLAKLGTGDGADAARRCHGSDKSVQILDESVFTCFNSNNVACNYWRQRCAHNSNCSACLVEMGNGVIARNIVADWSTPACQMAATDEKATFYLTAMVIGCPGISTCRNAITNCIFSYGDKCLGCLNGSAPTIQAAYCTALSDHYFFETACQSCPSSVYEGPPLSIVNSVRSLRL